MIIKSDDTIIDGNIVKEVEKSHLLKNAEGISERV